MKYTNGFDIDAINPVLINRVGWRSENLPRAFESFHAVCTESNLRAVQPTVNISDTDFTQYKATLKKDVIQRALSCVFNRPEFIQQTTLYRKVRNSGYVKKANQNLFTGIRFEIMPEYMYSHQLVKVVLLFDTTVTFNLYLYADGNPVALETIQVTAVANTPTTVALEDIYLKYDGVNVFYLGYKQSEIGNAKAIQETANWLQGICFNAYQFQIAESQINLFNYAWSLNPCGLNIEVNTFRDYTSLIVNNASLLDEAIGLQMVYFVLEQIVSSTRSNERGRILKAAGGEMALIHYLYGAVPIQGVAKMQGLNEILEEKYECIRKAFLKCSKNTIATLCPT